MIKIAVLGAGMVGKAIAIDLAKNYEVTSIDISDSSLKALQDKNPGIQILKKDLGDYDSYPEILSPFDIIVTAVPGFMGYKTLEAVILSKKNVVDISFFPENALELDEPAKENNVTAIVDCGVAPGMSNLILGYHNERMQIEKFECMVGGLPKEKIKPFEYKAPFSPIDVIEEYTRPARFIEDGKLITMPALTDAELVTLEKAGTLESFNTDGLRSLLFTMPGIKNMKEKTLRYPGHISLMKALIDGGFFDKEKITCKGLEISPLEFSSAVLFKQWKLGEEEEEFTIMQIKISGNKDGQQKIIMYDLYDEYDHATKTSSMARTTGYTCTAAVNLLANNLFNEKGVFPPELIGRHEQCFTFVLHYLKERNVMYKKTET
ncbi:MAG TPA: saccharopine dehydrogenase C-terminal domain-containing protein [Chitinophagaceae bacterium]|nr:saccharopine dehydrogenase C-terminal domain-containing protein [Chitinophagaceae bacterium]